MLIWLLFESSVWLGINDSRDGSKTPADPRATTSTEFIGSGE